MSLRSLDFRTKDFWTVVDRLSSTQKKRIVTAIGGLDLLRKKYLCKASNCRAKGLRLDLSPLDYACLVYAARITLDDVGRHSADKFSLARLGDRGPYRRRFCRFVPFSVNRAEMHVPPDVWARAAKKATDTKRKRELADPTVYLAGRKKAAKKFKSSDYVKNLKAVAAQKRADFERNCARPHTLNDKNSQFGTFWITDGQRNQKWSAAKGKLPRTFRKGRSL